MMQIDMTWSEIKKHLKQEMPIQVLADLNGIGQKTMVNVIKKLEEEHGEKVLPPPKRGRPKTKTPARSTRYARKKQELMTPPQIVPINPKAEDILAPLDQTVEEFFGPEPEQKRRFDPGVIDCIDANIDGLKDELQKLEDQMEMLKKQLADWEYLLTITEGGKT